MKITSIRKRGSDVEIIFEDFSKAVIDYRVIFDNGLRKNDDVSESELKNIIAQHEKLKTKDSAFRLLGRRHHSQFELKTKLIKKGFDKNIIVQVLSDLEEKGWINDLEFAQLYVQESLRKKKSGINKIKAGLIHKGVNSKIIEQIISQTDSMSSENTAFELAVKKLNTLKKRELDPRTVRNKISAYLFSKGFEGEIIIKVVNKLNIDGDNPDL